MNWKSDIIYLFTYVCVGNTEYVWFGYKWGVQSLVQVGTHVSPSDNGFTSLTDCLAFTACSYASI